MIIIITIIVIIIDNNNDNNRYYKVRWIYYKLWQLSFYHKVWHGLLQIASDITLSATVHVYETFVRYNRLGAKKL